VEVGCSPLIQRARPHQELLRARRRFLGNLTFTGLRFGNIVAGGFTPVLAKHSKSFSLIDRISVGVDRMQRKFEPMRKQPLPRITGQTLVVEGGFLASGANQIDRWECMRTFLFRVHGLKCSRVMRFCQAF
jgi:hypothetical protein